MAKTTKTPKVQKQNEVINNEIIREGLGSLYENQIVLEPESANENDTQQTTSVTNTNTSITPPEEPETEDDSNQSQPKPQDATGTGTDDDTNITPASKSEIVDYFYEKVTTLISGMRNICNLNEIKYRCENEIKSPADVSVDDAMIIIDEIIAFTNACDNNKEGIKSISPLTTRLNTMGISNNKLLKVVSCITYDNIRKSGLIMKSVPRKPRRTTRRSSSTAACSSISATASNTTNTTNTTTPTSSSGANINITYGAVNVTVTNPVATTNTGSINTTPTDDTNKVSISGIKNNDKLRISKSVIDNLTSEDREFFRNFRLSDTAAGKPIIK